LLLIFSIISCACWSLISIGTWAGGALDGPASDMIEMGEVGVEGVEKAGDVERGCKKAILNNSTLVWARDPVLDLRFLREHTHSGRLQWASSNLKTRPKERSVPSRSRVTQRKEDLRKEGQSGVNSHPATAGDYPTTGQGS